MCDRQWKYAGPMKNFVVERWSPALGAEVSGLDLDAALRGSDAQIDEVVDALYGALIEHQVLFLRDQPLSPEMHAELGRRRDETRRVVHAACSPANARADRPVVMWSRLLCWQRGAWRVPGWMMCAAYLLEE